MAARIRSPGASRPSAPSAGPSLHPARVVPLAFLATIALGTLLLLLPVSRAADAPASLMTALFTATSAVCVTGLAVVDTATYWSGFGRAVILALFQVGGFGIMTGATLLGLLVSRRLRLGTRLIAQAETRAIGLGEVKPVLRLILATFVAVEATVALLVAWRLHAAHDMAWPEAAWSGLFHAVSAFNNAGFSIYSDGLAGFVDDGLLLLPLMLAVVVGGLGFPVLHELRRSPSTPARWSVHTKITLLGTAILLGTGFVATLAYEWSNPATLGALAAGDRVVAAAFHSVMTRTAGFNVFDIGAMHAATLGVTDVLMLIGGGSAGTAGGIKVTTFFLLGSIVWAEVSGASDTNVFRRRIARSTQRQALSVVLLAIGTIALAVLVLLSVSPFRLEVVLFEAISAFATVGLSTGITGELPASGQFVLVVLMYMGRVGTITLASALALRAHGRPFRYPEERPIVG
ncbi:TrkH family potassium uptake protein [Coralloluteibacterium stylophorae]|uniref:TrkH family potassium uptake protein n=1 Tax=Coralloluteibacterium stylophorae TaxID=1776034 RepID=A0A8J8AXI0_9GAMM|nr:potassium transporter TrkG [Coralloluteibacterium stylophorae]MBS7457878.1 hypothetical protein [Coralloluteibacterium stylophorae]